MAIEIVDKLLLLSGFSHIHINASPIKTEGPPWHTITSITNF